MVWDKEEKRYKQAVCKSECPSDQYSYEKVFSLNDHQRKKKMKNALGMDIQQEKDSISCFRACYGLNCVLQIHVLKV